MATNQDRDAMVSEGVYVRYTLKDGAVVRNGTLVTVDTSNGLAESGRTAAGRELAGVAAESADASEDTVLVRTEGVFEFAASGLNQGSVGSIAYIVDNDTVKTVAGSNPVKVGRIVEFISATRCRVKLIHEVS